MRIRRCLGLLGSVAVVAGVLISAGTTHAASRHGSAVPITRTVTVLSFNIQHAEGTDGVLDLDRVAHVIRSSGAGIVGLQELDRHYSARSNWLDEPTELARRLHMHVAFDANIDRAPPAAGQPRRQFGSAILSRYPIVASSNTYLYRSPDLEQRGLLRAVIDVHGLLVDAYNTHLEVSSQSDRLRQTAQIKSLIGTPHAPTLLTGDMNATAGAPEIATLNGFLTDSWTVAGTGPGYTGESTTPTKRIDYVFGTHGVQPLMDRVIHTDPAASDHLPVAATVQLTGDANWVG